MAGVGLKENTKHQRKCPRANVQGPRNDQGPNVDVDHGRGGCNQPTGNSAPRYWAGLGAAAAAAACLIWSVTSETTFF